MASSKYGRLFTEAEVKRMMRYAYAKGEEGEIVDEDEEGLPVDAGAVLLAYYERDMAEDEVFGGAFPPTFPADEPLLVLRGQDRYAPWGAQFYVKGLEEHLADVGAGEANVSRAHYEAAHRAWQAMLAWQIAHPNRVKVPE